MVVKIRKLLKLWAPFPLYVVIAPSIFILWSCNYTVTISNLTTIASHVSCMCRSETNLDFLLKYLLML